MSYFVPAKNISIDTAEEQRIMLNTKLGFFYAHMYRVSEFRKTILRNKYRRLPFPCNFLFGVYY